MDCQIPPLMLFPFIENAFKHGTSSLGKSKVEIAIESDETSLQLVVKNSVRRNGAISTHTGLANIRKRLELQFPGTHRLDIEKDEENFKVMLKIPVS